MGLETIFGLLKGRKIPGPSREEIAKDLQGGVDVFEIENKLRRLREAELVNSSVGKVELGLLHVEEGLDGLDLTGKNKQTFWGIVASAFGKLFSGGGDLDNKESYVNLSPDLLKKLGLSGKQADLYFDELVRQGAADSSDWIKSTGRGDPNQATPALIESFRCLAAMKRSHKIRRVNRATASLEVASLLRQGGAKGDCIIPSKGNLEPSGIFAEGFDPEAQRPVGIRKSR